MVFFKWASVPDLTRIDDYINSVTNTLVPILISKHQIIPSAVFLANVRALVEEYGKFLCN